MPVSLQRASAGVRYGCVAGLFEPCACAGDWTVSAAPSGSGAGAGRVRPARAWDFGVRVRRFFGGCSNGIETWITGGLAHHGALAVTRAASRSIGSRLIPEPTTVCRRIAGKKNGGGNGGSGMAGKEPVNPACSKAVFSARNFTATSE